MQLSEICYNSFAGKDWKCFTRHCVSRPRHARRIRNARMVQHTEEILTLYDPLAQWIDD